MAIKRSKLLHFMNTTPSSTATYYLMNTGITSLSINKNPTYLEEGYIADEVGSKQLESLAPEFTFEINVDADDEVSKFLTGLEWNDKTLTEVETDIVSVQYWKTPTGTAYPAKKYKVSVSVETIGDEALKTLKHSVTCGVMGDAVFGTFNTSSKAFSAT
jgi:hypothetical protein